MKVVTPSHPVERSKFVGGTGRSVQGRILKLSFYVTDAYRW